MREVKIPFGREAIGEYFERYKELDVRKMQRFLERWVGRQVDMDEEELKWQVRYAILPVVIEKLQEKKVPSELVVVVSSGKMLSSRVRRVR